MPTALIIGAGSRVGHATATAFAGAGYSVAVASRTAQLDAQFKHFVFDAAKPETVPALFESVRKTVGIPSVVVYNAAASDTTKPETPFETPLDVLLNSFTVNAAAGWASARESVQAFEDLNSKGELGAAGGTFIFTGNALSDSVAPGFLPFGMGKTAGAYLVKHLALSAYPGKPYKFYWADQRLEDGTPMYTGLSGPAHADLYLELAKDPEQRPWQQTFVKDKGYTEFPRLEVFGEQ